MVFLERIAVCIWLYNILNYISSLPRLRKLFRVLLGIKTVESICRIVLQYLAE